MSFDRCKWFAISAVAIATAIAGCGGSDDDVADSGPVPLTVPKATCGSSDKPESALQGQVPASMRSSFGGFNCNLQLVAQSRGDGAGWQTAEFKDKSGHTCAYHGTSIATDGRTHVGARVLDITNAAAPTPTAYLTTTAMLDPWESLKVNDRRQLLAAGNGANGGGGPEVDFYDLSGDCRTPQLLASVAVGQADGSTGTPATGPILGHEGAWSPDGLTYYGGDTRNQQYYAVDATNTTKPKLLSQWKTGIANAHGLSIGDDGTRGYFVSYGNGTGFTDPAVAANNGLLIYDLTDFQSRKASPQPRIVGSVFWKDGSFAQHTIPVKIGGKAYVISVDEGGSGGISSAAQEQAACAANMTPFAMARIIDASDEKAPKIASRLMLEVHDPANCDKVLPDLVGLTTFTYGSHYCSVDNRQNATTLACSYFNAGIRVFDIRNPERPREIAYYNPPGTTTKSPGSNHVALGANWTPGSPDWCSAQLHLDASRGTIWTTCQDNGLLMLKFENGVWPFPETTTPAGQQN